MPPEELGMHLHTCDVDREVVAVVAIGAMGETGVEAGVGHIKGVDLQVAVAQMHALPVQQCHLVFGPPHHLVVVCVIALQIQPTAREPGVQGHRHFTSS